MVESIEIETHDLLILFNLLAERGEPVVVEYPFYDAEVLTYDAKEGKLTAGTSNARFPIRPTTPDTRILSELPSWDTIADALVTAGYAPYPNEAELRDTLQGELRHALEDPTPAFLAFDTNALYLRLASRGLPDRLLAGSSEAEHPMAAFRYAVSQGVRDELGHHLHKYSEGHVNALTPLLRGEIPVKALLNRTVAKGRRAAAGLAETKWLKARFRTQFCPCAPLNPARSATTPSLPGVTRTS